MTKLETIYLHKQDLSTLSEEQLFDLALENMRSSTHIDEGCEKAISACKNEMLKRFGTLLNDAWYNNKEMVPLEMKIELEKLRAGLRVLIKWSEDVVKALSLLSPRSLLLEHLRQEAAELEDFVQGLLADG